MIAIYRIRNIINNKSYYGSSKNIDIRWKKHKNELNKNKHNNILLQRAWNKYGRDNFLFEIIEECEFKDLLIKEQFYLDKKPNYNIGMKSSGGDNFTNNPNKEDIINRISKTLIKTFGNMSEEDRIEKFSMPKEKNPNWKGGISVSYCKCGNEIKPTNKTCIKCRDKSGVNNPFYGKQHTEITKEIIKNKRIGTYNGNQNIPFIIDGINYDSLGKASKELNIPTTTIRWRLKSNNIKYKNYKYL